MDADELQPLLLRYSLHHAAPEPQPAAHQQRYASQDFWDARFQDAVGFGLRVVFGWNDIKGGHFNFGTRVDSSGSKKIGFDSLAIILS